MGISLISNPPYNMPWTAPALAGFMQQYMGWQIAPKKNANYAFIQTGLSFIDSKAAFIMPNGCLTTSLPDEILIKKQLIKENLVSAIISLPDSMFESTSIPTSIILLDKNKQTLNIEMVDMKNECSQEVRDQNGQYGGNSHEGRTYHKTINVLTDEGIKKALDAIEHQQNIRGFCKSVSQEAVRSNEYNLSPSRYIDQDELKMVHRSFEDIANDYNRVIKQKNAIKIKMNKTAAKRLGYDCMDINHPDLTESFEIVGQKAEKENFISFSADDGIQITISTKTDIHPLILELLKEWRQLIMYLNNEENRYLAEFRDALLPELMNGNIKVRGDG